EQLLYKKYAISVVTGENYGSKDTGKILNKLLQYSGAYLCGNVICNVPFNNDPCSKKIDKQLERVSKKFYADIKKHRNYPFQSFFRKTIFSVGIKPFVMSKGELYKGVITKWKNIGIS
ncbi:MAG: hypothetical protein ACI4RG_06730, partial [Huintestinicola sp.]